MLKHLVYILALLSFTAHSQTMQGLVVDARTGKPLSPVTVVNTHTQAATSTDDKGMYTIPASVGDVIAFTYVGFKTEKRMKPASVIIATVNVSMEPAAFMLREFDFMPGNLTPYQRDSLERARTYKFPLQRTHPTLMSPASMLAEKFSRKAKMVYQFQKNFAAGEMEKFVDTRYTRQLVNELTGATGDTIGHFMYAYPMAYDFARLATELELKAWIRNNYRDWVKTARLDTFHSVH